MNFKIRQENFSDYSEVNSVVKRAFETAPHRDGNEHNLVSALRKSDAFIPELSLVAVSDCAIIGHALYTRVKISGTTQLALAPVAVLPEHQKLGVGRSLIREGHDIAKKLGYNYCVLLGDPSYYSRLGYHPAQTFGIKPPFDVKSEYFMAICLNPLHLNGVVEYPKEFGI